MGRGNNPRNILLGPSRFTQGNKKIFIPIETPEYSPALFREFYRDLQDFYPDYKTESLANLIGIPEKKHTFIEPTLEGRGNIAFSKEEFREIALYHRGIKSFYNIMTKSSSSGPDYRKPIVGEFFIDSPLVNIGEEELEEYKNFCFTKGLEVTKAHETALWKRNVWSSLDFVTTYQDNQEIWNKYFELIQTYKETTSLIFAKDLNENHSLQNFRKTAGTNERIYTSIHSLIQDISLL